MERPSRNQDRLTAIVDKKPRVRNALPGNPRDTRQNIRSAWLHGTIIGRRLINVFKSEYRRTPTINGLTGNGRDGKSVRWLEHREQIN